MKKNTISTKTKEEYIIALLYLMLLISSILPKLLPMVYYHDSQRLVVNLIFLVILSIRFVSGVIISKGSVSLLLIVLIWGSITSLQSLNPLWSIIEVCLFLSIAITVIFIFPLSNVWLLSQLALIFASIQLVYATINYFNYVLIYINNVPFDPWLVIDGFSNIRFYSQFLTWTIPFLTGYIAVSKNSNYRLIVFSSIILSWILVLMSGTRAFVFGIVSSIIAVSWFLPNIWKSYLKWTFITGTIGTIGSIILIWLAPSPIATFDDHLFRVSDRITLWSETISVIIDRPYVGIGPMLTAMEGILTRFAHPHNFILQLMAEWGVPFAIFFIIFLGYAAFRWKYVIAENPTERESLALPITASVSAAIAVGLVSGIIVMPISLLYMTLVLGFGMALWRTWTPQIQRSVAPLWLAILLLTPVVLLSSVTTMHWCTKILHAPKERRCAKSPRFWIYGKISQDEKNPFYPSFSNDYGAVKNRQDISTLLH
ncbi:hypothetical protein TI05_01910 [Achromatium sp. WMS3]|nr:hypothetical protein TI05_01910 [Achromatium sp. WMS3]